jgi:hypothetical protein
MKKFDADRPERVMRLGGVLDVANDDRLLPW